MLSNIDVLEEYEGSNIYYGWMNAIQHQVNTHKLENYLSEELDFEKITEISSGSKCYKSKLMNLDGSCIMLLANIIKTPSMYDGIEFCVYSDSDVKIQEFFDALTKKFELKDFKVKEGLYDDFIKKENNSAKKNCIDKYLNEIRENIRENIREKSHK